MTAESTATSRLLEVAGLFLRLGSTAFGGPAVHTALMHDEVVKRRGWLTDQEFLDLLGATNLIPGPNSTEMAIHIGYLRAGWPGLILAGACFILPSMLIVMVLAWIYSRFGQTPEAGWILYGIKPVVIAIILKALWDMGRKALRNPISGLTGLGALALNLFGINELVLLFGGGLAVMLARVAAKFNRKDGLAALLPVMGLGAPGLAEVSALAAAAAAAAPFGLGVLFLTFLKIGAVLYGSGYVLLAFLRADFVLRLGWLTDQQIIDAVAIGQFTPGPLSTTATFIGYQLGGVPGALLATLGIFLPGFIFVALTNPVIPRLRRSPWLGGFLDGVNAASLGLMAAVTARLGQAALVDGLSIALGVVSAILLLRVKINPTWLIAGGAIVGLVRLFVF
jgi:chromate transporter